ncbi:MAG TPA: beta galactosidase jelly roll domain-containing protein [Terracidiphilus sp.]|nr:beta galactosidase jelly roll domain-containing protein [Terracidiphilus sp.]
MKKSMWLVVVGAMAPVVCAAGTVTPLHEGWRLQSACTVKADGAAISAAGFATEGWLAATVPTTVLAAQVADKVVPDPYFGMNLRGLAGESYPIGHNFSNLPMPDDSPYKCGWWYRTEFKAPAAEGRDRRFWLHFGGINYRADIWVNGKKVADSSDVAGAYRTYDFDVTDVIKPGANNVLAVETFAPTEKDLGINWVDWNPAPPDKDMGLIGEVNLVETGPVALRSPMAVTHFTDPTLTTAELTVYAELENGADHPVQGRVEGTAAGARLEQAVTLGAHEHKTVVFTPEQFPQLKLHDPQPWWPAQMGVPHLEQLTMSFETGSFEADGAKSDEKTVEFGIREITSELTGTGARLFRINGKPLLIRGGGWSQDMLLRTDQKRLEEQFALVEDMHLNTIRLEGKLDTDAFFKLADQKGILVLMGWCCCDQWEHWRDWKPENLKVAAASLRSQMLRLRYHASDLVWLNGSDNAPPPNVEHAYLDVEKETHWPNPTLASASATDTVGGGPSGVKMTGPYDYVGPSYWYIDKQFGGAWGFNTETSPGPAIPSEASRAKFLTDPSAWPPTADWSLHMGGGEFATLKVFDEAMAAQYAKPDSAADYTRIANAMEYDSERAMYEAYSRNKYTSTGVIQWMLNNAWPSMIWHLYDYNLDAGAGYFATKKACEPVHIQYSYDDHSIVVVNSTYKPADGLTASVEVHGLGWNKLYSRETAVNAAADSSQQAMLLPDSLWNGMERLLFIDLKLKDAAGKVVSRNFYWVPYTLTTFDWNRTEYTHTPAERYPDLQVLTHLSAAQVTATADTVNGAHGRVVKVRLENRGQTLAFQVSAAARTADGGLVAPVFWSDNWIELAPGESETLTARLPDDAPADTTIRLEGWNVAEQTLHPAAGH